MDQTKRREGTAHIGKNNKFEGFVSKNIRWSNDKKHFWWTFFITKNVMLKFFMTWKLQAAYKSFRNWWHSSLRWHYTPEMFYLYLLDRKSNHIQDGILSLAYFFRKHLIHMNALYTAFYKKFAYLKKSR